MKRKRIQIDGVWYVEETIKNSIQMDIVAAQSLTIEDNVFRFELEVLSEYPNVPYIVVTVKSSDYKEHWDNGDFLRGLIENDAVEISKFVEDFPIEYLQAVQGMIQEGIDRKWIKW